MPSSLRCLYFLLTDIQLHRSLQIKHSDTLNMVAINAIIEKHCKEMFKLTILFHLLELQQETFPLVFIPKHCNYV